MTTEINNPDTPLKGDYEDAEHKSLGDRMKEAEEKIEQTIPPYCGFIARSDGKGFSKYTKNLKKPFDPRFVSAMALANNYCVEKFNAVFGTCHSDEDSLFFAPVCTKEEYTNGTNKSTHQYSGRVQKLVSLIASTFSAQFNYHFTRLIKLNERYYDKKTVDTILSNPAVFDCRIIIIPEDKPQEAVNYCIWRSVYDCHRNAVSTYARSKFSHKKVDGKNTPEKIEMLKEEGITWDTDVPMFLKYGIYCKREQYTKITDRPEGPVEALRTRTVNKTFKITYSDDMVRVLYDKYWDNKSDIKMLTVTMSEDGAVKEFM
jgi:tRNA(His) guanylyltransferase